MNELLAGWRPDAPGGTGRLAGAPVLAGCGWGKRREGGVWLRAAGFAGAAGIVVVAVIATFLFILLGAAVWDRADPARS